MTLLSLVVALVLIGFVLWAINTYIPMDPKIKNLLNVVVILVLILWILQALGFLGTLASIRVTRP